MRFIFQFLSIILNSHTFNELADESGQYLTLNGFVIIIHTYTLIGNSHKTYITYFRIQTWTYRGDLESGFVLVL